MRSEHVDPNRCLVSLSDIWNLIWQKKLAPKFFSKKATAKLVANKYLLKKLGAFLFFKKNLLKNLKGRSNLAPLEIEIEI